MTEWPHIHLVKINGRWTAYAKNCNVVGFGSTPREAYEDWQWWFRVPV